MPHNEFLNIISRYIYDELHYPNFIESGEQLKDFFNKKDIFNIDERNEYGQTALSLAFGREF